jgi:TolB-like protein
VVADFDNETADSAFATWGDMAGDIIATRLARVPGLNVVTSQRWLPRTQQVQRQADAPASLRDLAMETNAATVVTGGYYRNEQQMELILEVTDARSGALMRTYGPVSVSPAAPDSSVLALGVHLGLALDSLMVRRSAGKPGP